MKTPTDLTYRIRMPRTKAERRNKVKRKCLSCDSVFIAFGKLMRLCGACKQRIRIQDL